MKKRRLKPSNVPPTIEQLQRSLRPFCILGWGEHQFRYAVRYRPHGIVLCEKWLGEWRIVENSILRFKVELNINNKNAYQIVSKQSEKERVVL